VSARLYARLEGWGSYAQVSHGFELGLEAHDVLAGVYPVDEELDLDDDPPPGASAHVGVFTGAPPSVVSLVHNAAHVRRFAMLAPNSDRVPTNILGLFETVCTDLLTPSEWASEVLRAQSKLPVHTVPHGLQPEFAPLPDLREAVARAYERERFRVVHLSSSPQQRKSTVELVRAWQWAVERGALPPQSELTLLLDPLAAGAFLERLSDQGSGLPANSRLLYRLEGGRGAPPERMARFLSEYHLVCQPSRAEGFGLVPLEARACGVPVVATRCTGHSEHMPFGSTWEEGVSIVAHGHEAPIDDVPGSSAPTVSVEAIEAALEIAYDNWTELCRGALAKAEEVRTVWSWKQQLAPFARLVEECDDS